MNQVFDLLIIGGGVSGSALLYLTAQYSDIKHICMLENYAAPARVNSLHSNNSQKRYNWDTLGDFLQIFRFDKKVANVLMYLLKVSEIRNYMLKNLLFEVPLLRRRLFLKDTRKIVPDLKFTDIKFAHHVGGIRPQLIHKEKRQLMMGEAKIDTGVGAIFNMTPSPGATCCLENAEVDMRSIAEYFGASIDEERFANDLLIDDSQHHVEDLAARIITGEDAE